MTRCVFPSQWQVEGIMTSSAPVKGQPEEVKYVISGLEILSDSLCGKGRKPGMKCAHSGAIPGFHLS